MKKHSDSLLPVLLLNQRQSELPVQFLELLKDTPNIQKFLMADPLDTLMCMFHGDEKVKNKIKEILNLEKDSTNFAQLANHNRALYCEEYCAEERLKDLNQFFRAIDDRFVDRAFTESEEDLPEVE